MVLVPELQQLQLQLLLLLQRNPFTFQKGKSPESREKVMSLVKSLRVLARPSTFRGNSSASSELRAPIRSRSILISFFFFFFFFFSSVHGPASEQHQQQQQQQQQHHGESESGKCWRSGWAIVIPPRVIPFLQRGGDHSSPWILLSTLHPRRLQCHSRHG